MSDCIKKRAQIHVLPRVMAVSFVTSASKQKSVVLGFSCADFEFQDIDPGRSGWLQWQLPYSVAVE